MSRGLLQLTSLALLGVIGACGGAKGTETAMLKNPPGTVVFPDSGHGSGGHLMIVSHCRIDPVTLLCVVQPPPSGVADSGMGSGGHREALMIMTCEADAAKVVTCSAPLSNSE